MRIVRERRQGSETTLDARESFGSTGSAAADRPYPPRTANPVAGEDANMDPEETLGTVESAIDALVEASEPHDGLFPSIIDRTTCEMAQTTPPDIPGQRPNDRAPLGCNPIHDVPTLRTMYAFAESERRPEFARAADRYVERFATRCADTATGLLPWGEHAFWHLEEDRPGNGYDFRDGGAETPIHDHLRLVPAWLWEEFHAVDPAVVHDFADGLRYHWNDPEKPEYNRHAYITRKGRYPIRNRSCDFPRHGGFYVYDWAFAYSKDEHPEYVRQIEKMMAYWWRKRDPAHQGLLRFESRGRTDELSPRQTLSLAASLLDAATLLEANGLEPRLRDRLQACADVYLDGVLAAPHDPGEGVFLSTCRESDLRRGAFEPRTGPDVEYEIRPMTIWGDVYSGVLAAPLALLCLSAYRQTGREDLLRLAEAVGSEYASTPFPEGGTVSAEAADAVLNPSTLRSMDADDEIPIPSRDVGLALALFADLSDVTDGDCWTEAGLQLTETAVETYCDATLPRGAATADHYENQMGTGYLLYGLARVALRARDGSNCVLGPDYTER